MKLRILLPLAALVLVALAGLTLLFGPRTPTAKPLPVPNGYDDFLAAVKVISSVPPTKEDWQKLDLVALRTFVASNAPALARARMGLTRQCRLPPISSLTNLEAHIAQIGGFKRTAQAFAAESRLAALEQRTNAAALAALDCIRFGQESTRGGPLIDSLVGVAIRAIGLAQLNRVVVSVDAPTLKQLAGDLEAILATRETSAEVMANEELFTHNAFPLSQRIAGRIATWTSGDQSIAKTMQKLDADAQSLARTMLDCAALAYQLDHGNPPQSLTNLVPTYLKTIPTDPVTGQTMPLPVGR